jgi:hypothetical protein
MNNWKGFKMVVKQDPKVNMIEKVMICKVCNLGSIDGKCF